MSINAADARAQAKAAKAYAKAQRPWYQKKRVITPAILGALMVGGLATSGDDGSTSTTTGRPLVEAAPVLVHAKTFGDEFDTNQVAAERKYKGKRVQLTAKVTNITDGSVSFGEVTTEISLTQIACRLSNPNQALTLKNGQNATIIGTVSDQSLGVITLKDCSITG